ncbi:MAG: phenylalanine--tRNA ligase subunit alpha [Holosporales bacterium]|nr:phenylalanine--tRNA ligase subunit alpha [Holosporales bacterium]
MEHSDLENNIESSLEEIDRSSTLGELDDIRTKILGRSGIVNSAFKVMASIPGDQKKAFGARINILKEKVEMAIREKRKELENIEIATRLANEDIDATLPACDSEIGSLHIISKMVRNIRKRYHARGFLVLDGPEVESEFHNFDALNIPAHHPARQSHDTFYIKNFAGTLLRTHTSTVQIRSLMERGVPIRMISIGKTYRSDNLDATHSPMFHQVEGLVVEREPLSVGNLKKELQRLIAACLEIDDIDEVNVRFRPSYFPFTEPSMEVDCMHEKIGHKWIELGGAGMVHPNVYKNCCLDSDGLYGFAFGFGLERVTMLRNQIHDIRSLYDTDVRWLKHY